MTSRDTQRCCEAVRSAVLATAWLLVNTCTLRTRICVLSTCIFHSSIMSCFVLTLYISVFAFSNTCDFSAPNRKRTCDFLLVINSNCGLASTVFEMLTFKARRYLAFSTIPCLMSLTWGSPLEFLDETYPAKIKGWATLHNANFNRFD